MGWKALFSVAAYLHGIGVFNSTEYTIPADAKWLRLTVLLDEATVTESVSGVVTYEFSVDGGATWRAGADYEWAFVDQPGKFGVVNYTPTFLHSVAPEYQGAKFRGKVTLNSPALVGFAIDWSDGQ